MPRRNEVALIEPTTRIMRAVRKAERVAGDGGEIGGTGFTILKLSDSPLVKMLNDGRIGATELRAAEDFSRAYFSMVGALWFRPLSWERQDRSHGRSEPVTTLDALDRYRTFADIWSVRAKRGDPTMRILVDAVCESRPFREIEADLALRHGTASKAAAAGLRDYAARAGWAIGRASQSWLVSEGAVFRLRRLRAA